MKILLVTGRYRPEICGIGDYTWNLKNQFEKQGHEVFVLTKGNSSAKTEPNVLYWRKNWGLFSMFGFSQYIHKLKPDIVHVQYEAFSYQQSYLFILELYRLRIPLYVTLHEIFHRNYLQKIRDRLLYRKAKAIIVNDSAAMEKLNVLFSETKDKIYKIGVGSNIPGVNKIDPFIPIQNEQLQVAFFGFINAVKAIDSLLAMIPILSKIIGQNIQLLLLGDISKSQSQELKRKAEFLSLNESSLIIPGPMSGNLIAEYISGADLVILPYTDGASPRRGSLQAAWALGKPIVTTKPNILDPELKDGENLVFASSLEARDLANAAARIVSDRNLQAKLQKNSIETSKYFSWEKIACSHANLYQKDTVQT